MPILHILAVLVVYGLSESDGQDDSDLPASLRKNRLDPAYPLMGRDISRPHSHQPSAPEPVGAGPPKGIEEAGSCRAE